MMLSTRSESLLIKTTSYCHHLQFTFVTKIEVARLEVVQGREGLRGEGKMRWQRKGWGTRVTDTSWTAVPVNTNVVQESSRQDTREREKRERVDSKLTRMRFLGNEGDLEYMKSLLSACAADDGIRVAIGGGVV